MKTLIASLLLVLSACATAPGIKIAKSPSELKGCEGIPTFAPLTCGTEKSCEECVKKLSSEVKSLGGNAMLIQQQGKVCKASEMTATPFRCN